MDELLYLCLAAAISEQLTAGSKLRDGVRLIVGMIAARRMLRVLAALPLSLLQ